MQKPTLDQMKKVMGLPQTAANIPMPGVKPPKAGLEVPEEAKPPKGNSAEASEPNYLAEIAKALKAINNNLNAINNTLNRRR